MVFGYFHLKKDYKGLVRTIKSYGRDYLEAEGKARAFAKQKQLGNLSGGCNYGKIKDDIYSFCIFEAPRDIKPIYKKYGLVDTIINLDNGLITNKDKKIIKKNKTLLKSFI